MRGLCIGTVRSFYRNLLVRVRTLARRASVLHSPTFCPMLTGEIEKKFALVQSQNGENDKEGKIIMKKMSLIIRIPESDSANIICHLYTNLSQEDAVTAIKKAATEFFDSQEGSKALAEALGKPNWGDIITSVPAETFARNGVILDNIEENVLCVNHDDIVYDSFCKDTPTSFNHQDRDYSQTSSEVKDEEFLCDSMDRIDNAVFDYIKSTMQKDDSQRFDCFKEATLALCVDESSYRQLNQGTKIEIEEKLANTTKDILQNHNITDPAMLEWNMEIIGDVLEELKSLLILEDVNTCHPWEDENEHICYSTGEKCWYCRKKY